MLTVHRNTIAAFKGSYLSGLAQLIFTDGSVVHCDNGPTVRALNAAFKDVIAPNHCVNNAAINGQDIFWWYDDLGLTLGGFMPYSEDTAEAIENAVFKGQLEYAE